MIAARRPYADTKVEATRSQSEISEQLRSAGARGVQFETEWDEDGVATRCVVRFAMPVGDEDPQIVRVRLSVAPDAPEPQRGNIGSPKQKERQAWRALQWYLEGQIKASQFGLVRFEEIFLSHIEVGPNGETIGEMVIPQLEAGRLQLNAGKP